MSEEVKRIITIETAASQQSLNQLKKKVSELTAELNETVTGSAQFEAKLKQLSVVQKQYASIQGQITAQTQLQKKEMVNLGQTGEALAKS